MNTRMLGILAIGALFSTVLVTTSLAQPRPRGGFDGPRAVRPERFIELHDTDADGRVSENEFIDERLQRVVAQFERRDTNDDGLISADEQAAPRGLRDRPGLRPRRERSQPPALDRDAVTACILETIPDFEPRFDGEPEDRFDNADTDGDGMLGLQEVSTAVQAGASARFARIDGDGDGYVTADEAAAHAGAQRNLRQVANACAREELRG